MRLRVLQFAAALAAITLLSGCGAHVEFSADAKRLLVSGPKDWFCSMRTGRGASLLPNTENAAYAIWSPNGRYLLYEDPDWMGNRIRSRVFLYDLQTASARPLRGYLRAPYTFSHDGRQVVAWGERKECLVWVDVPSGERLLEVPCPVTPQEPRLYWLPDRQGVVFTAQEEDGRIDVYTVEAGKVYRLSTTGDVVGVGVSPDGKQVLWARQAGLDAGAVVTTFAYDLDARTVQKLPLQVDVRDLIRRKPPKGFQTSVRVTFSPDAQSALVVITQQGEKRYWARGVALPLTGGLPRELFILSSTDREGELPLSIAWSPDSERVAVLTLRGTEKDNGETAPRLRLLRVDGRAQRVVDL